MNNFETTNSINKPNYYYLLNSLLKLQPNCKKKLNFHKFFDVSTLFEYIMGIANMKRWPSKAHFCSLLIKIYDKTLQKFPLGILIHIKDKISQKIFFQKKNSPKIFPKKSFCQIFFHIKGGGEAPLLPTGPRLISSDSEISA